MRYMEFVARLIIIIHLRISHTQVPVFEIKIQIQVFIRLVGKAYQFQ